MVSSTTHPVETTILDLQGRIQQSNKVFDGRSLSIKSLSSGTCIAYVKVENQFRTMNFIVK
jgi:hypothetical protein